MNLIFSTGKSVAELNDAEWNCQVHFVLGEDPAATQVAIEKLTKSIDQRERFSMLTPENMLTHILDKKLRFGILCVSDKIKFLFCFNKQFRISQLVTRHHGFH